MTTFEGIDGTQLAYRQIGAGPMVVCLPGGPMQASVYLGDLGALPAQASLVMVDLRGTGRSSAPTDPDTYRCDWQVSDVESLRLHLGLEQLNLLGHSAGTNLAVAYAVQHPHRVARLALITPSARAVDLTITDDDRRHIAELRHDEEWFPGAFSAFGRIWAGEAGDDDWDAITPFTYGRWDHVARAHAAAAEAQRNADAAGIFGSSSAPDPEGTRAALASLAAPVLLLAGGYDVSLPPGPAAEYAALFPHSELVVQPRAGHYPWLDDAEQFGRTVGSFFA